MNIGIFLGRLTSDAKLYSTNAKMPDGTPVVVTNVSMIVENRKQTSAGTEKQTELIQFAVWRNQARALQPYLKKGKQIVVVGDVHPGSYTESDGSIKLKLQIGKTTQIELLGDARHEPLEPEIAQVDLDTADIPFPTEG